MADIPRVARWRQRNREAGKQAITLWLSAEDKAHLLDMAQQCHTSPSALVAEALKGYQPTRPAVPTDTDTRRIRLLIQEMLRDQLPCLVRQALADTGVVTETRADTVAATDTVAETLKVESATDTVTETSTETRWPVEVAEPATETVIETPVHPDLAEEVLEMLTGVTYDASRYKLGKLCRRGHDYEGTGQSLLYRRNSACVECDQESVTERRRAKRRG